MADATATTTTGNDYTSIIDALLKTWGAIEASKRGKFRQVPEDPAKIAMRNKLLGYIDNSPTRNALGGIINQYAKGARVGGDFRLPTSKNYDPNNTPKYTGPPLDFSGLINLSGGGGGSTPTPNAPTNPNPNGGNGITNSGPTTPLATTPGGGGDPFRNVPPRTGSNPNVDWSSVMSGIRQFGPAAITVAQAILTANPFAAVAGIIQGVKAYFSGDKTAGGNLHVNNPNLPDVTPDPRQGNNDYNQQYQDALARGVTPPSTSVNYRDQNLNTTYYDPATAANLQGMQESNNWSNVRQDPRVRLGGMTRAGGIGAV